MYDFEYARFFYKLAAIYGILEDSKYRSRSFHSAAMAMDAYGTHIEELCSRGELQRIPHVGAGIERRIHEIVDTGHLVELDDFETEYRIFDYSLLLNHGLPDRLVGKLLGMKIGTAKSLGKVREAKSFSKYFGNADLRRIDDFLATYARDEGLYLLSYGWCIGNELMGLMQRCGYSGVRIVGEVGRAQERVRSVEIVYAERTTRAQARLARLLRKDGFRYQLASVYGGKLRGDGPLGLPFAIRECQPSNYLPCNDWADSLDHIRGDLHCHTNWSDGTDPLEDVGAQAEAFGYEYQAITDHSAAMRVAHGMTELQVLEQIREIRRYNKSHTTKLIAGAEVDILADGSLDYSDEVLSQLDFVIAAIHTSLNQDQETLMARLEKALSNPYVNILAHPTGRLLGRPGVLFSSRKPYAVDMPRLISICKLHDVVLEINAFPERLDLCEEHIKMAVRAGVHISIGTDSHSVAHMCNIQYGAVLAHKAGVPSELLLNTYDYESLMRFFAEKRVRQASGYAEHGLVRKDFYHYFGSNQGIVTGCLSVIGIDLTGRQEKASGWALLKGSKATCRRVFSDADLIQSVVGENPAVVSIDSPLAYPRGRKNPSKDSPDSRFGIMRQCERDLRHYGVSVYPCLIDSMVNVTTRGRKLALELRKMGFTVIESYPGVAQDVLQIPRKGKDKEQFAHLKKGLASFGIVGDLLERADLSHDEADAITSALVGYFYLNGQYVALGNDDEEYLIVPRIQGELVTKRIVIGLCGESGAGKTTLAKYLNFKYGFGYFRYSQVIEEKYGVQGKHALQEVGDRISQNPSEQAALTQYMINRMDGAKSYVIDGLRHLEDYNTFKNAFGESFVFVYIDCTYRNRRKRYVGDGGVEISSGQFERLNDHPSESGIRPMLDLADVRLDNNTSYKHLREQADAIVERFAME